MATLTNSRPFDADCFDDKTAYFMDLHVSPRERKTRAMVMTPLESIMCAKSSKNHKLAPRTPKRDRTKTKEAKAHSKAVRFSHSA